MDTNVASALASVGGDSNEPKKKVELELSDKQMAALQALGLLWTVNSEVCLAKFQVIVNYAKYCSNQTKLDDTWYLDFKSSAAVLQTIGIGDWVKYLILMYVLV